jgi:TusA-related sulfurtransferase
VRRAYAALERGQLLEVRTPVAEHAFAVRAWCRKSGITLLADSKQEGISRLVFERGA